MQGTIFEAAAKLSLFGLAISLGPEIAFAQRAADNVTTQSSDAFGRTVGTEKSGLYSSDDVRGFDPVEAGNVRLEGLYFDLVDKISPRLVDGSSIRVGPAALQFPFPAPTGLVDYALNKPGNAAGLSVTLETGGSSIRGYGGSAEFKKPPGGSGIGLAGGLGWRQAVTSEGSRYHYESAGGTISWHPARDTEILLFGGGLFVRGDKARPTIYVSGSLAPPRLERGLYLSQDWARRDTDTWLIGTNLKTSLRGIQIEAGLIWSEKDNHSTFSDILSDVTSNGSAGRHRIVANLGDRDASLSGEIRAVKRWAGSRIDQRLVASVRGRSRQRRFGGSMALDLGATSLLERQAFPEPDIVIGPKNTDHTNQLSLGIAYSLVSRSGITLTAGVSKSYYRKEVSYADPSLADPVVSESPVTWNFGGAYRIVSGVTVYAAATSGREEALIAPDTATNRSEIPAAIHTRQIEAGVSVKLAPKLTLIAGAFSITKPYFGLDASLKYRELGDLDNRGIEFSLAGRLAPGLAVVAGTMFLDPRVSGEAVSEGRIGARPVGQLRRRSVLNLDWRSKAGAGPLSFDLAIESLSGRAGNAANSVNSPPRTVVNLGGRYRFTVSDKNLVVRAQALNAFNVYGWNVSSSGGWTYIPARSLSLQVVADF
ncbi:MAG: TonB-dependent receptor [Proteobacteria bacterium]|jgi:iron complex outermembrane receptor protein|nr:TonB-dependent receptor [Pseudomonadota bacterium]